MKSSIILGQTQVKEKLDELTATRKNWETNEYAASNAKLYAILEKCFEVLSSARRSTKLRRFITQELEDRGVRFKAGTQLETRIARWVFGDCSNRIAAYSRVLKLAHTDKPEKQSLSDWIVSKGGVENIRRESTSKPKLSRKEKVKRATEYFESAESLFELQVDKPDVFLPNDDADNDFCVVLVRPNGKSGLEIIHSCNAESVVNSVLVRAASEIGLGAEKTVAIASVRKPSEPSFEDEILEVM